MKKFIAVVLALIVSLALSFAPGANVKAESMTPEEMVQADLNLVVYDLLSVDVLNQTQTYSDLDITASKTLTRLLVVLAKSGFFPSSLLTFQ